MKRQLQDDNVSVRILVHGRVQGVGFRQSVRKQARLLGLDAKAHNRDDGSVLIESTGPRAIVDKLTAWAHSGPALARVDDVTVINTGRPRALLTQIDPTSTGNSPSSL